MDISWSTDKELLPTRVNNGADLATNLIWYVTCLQCAFHTCDDGDPV